MMYEASARECAACPFASACGPLAQKDLATLRAELGIVPPTAVTKATLTRKALAATGLLANPAMPKKVAAHIERLDRLGIKVTPALAEGKNPFAGKKPLFLRIACHLLLTAKDGFTRDQLVMCFTHKLLHTPDTAQAHAKQAVQILEALGAARELNGKIEMTVPK
jgi:hypothetical protein